MRRIALSLLVTLSAASLGLACSSTEEDDVEASDSNLTDMELATMALKIMGASQIPRESNDAPSCAFTGCHSVNTVSVKQWGDQYKAAIAVLEDPNKTQEEKINWFRQNPNNPETKFVPERIGIMTAGAHLGLGANVSPTRHPEAHKQGKLLADIFRGKDEL